VANALYPKFKEALLSGAVNLSSNAVKVCLVDLADYTYSSSHQFLSDVPLAAREEISSALTGKAILNGNFDSDDPTFVAATGDTCESLILFIDTGSPSTSRLIAFYDTGVTGLPVILNGGNINVQVDALGWFAL
jgi:hypothetical protein